MERAEKVREQALKMIEGREKPSVRKLSAALKMSEQDVHRCLNHLEREGDVETYIKEVFGTKNRMVSVKR